MSSLNYLRFVYCCLASAWMHVECNMNYHILHPIRMPIDKRKGNVRYWSVLVYIVSRQLQTACGSESSLEVWLPHLNQCSDTYLLSYLLWPKAVSWNAGVGPLSCCMQYIWWWLCSVRYQVPAPEPLMVS